ncbi:MAG: hypothetical protein ACI4HN_03790 [Ruminococcus sp.]
MYSVYSGRICAEFMSAYDITFTKKVLKKAVSCSVTRNILLVI